MKAGSAEYSHFRQQNIRRSETHCSKMSVMAKAIVLIDSIVMFILEKSLNELRRNINSVTDSIRTTKAPVWHMYM